MVKLTYILALSAILFSTSCTSGSLENRIKLANQIAKDSNLTKDEIKAKDWTFLTFSKITNPKKPLNVYIEGDGFAWKNKYTISLNPTPKNPMSLRLAAIDQAPNILYIARPCQYVDLNEERNCDDKFWTGSRFSKEVVHDINRVINKFTQDYKFNRVNLYGYSGGAALAVLTASERKDVRSIKTVAGNLNHKALMMHHGVTPLYDSLDAIDVAENVAHIWQYHLIGGKDKTVTKESIMSFVDKARHYNIKRVNFGIVEDAGHRYKNWPKEWAKTFPKQRK